MHFVTVGEHVPSEGTLIFRHCPCSHSALSLSNFKTSQAQFALTLTSVSMFIGDFKAFPSLLKMAGAAVLYGFRPTNEHRPECGAKMSFCNLNHLEIVA